jgi:hypothetical protein
MADDELPKYRDEPSRYRWRLTVWRDGGSDTTVPLEVGATAGEIRRALDALLGAEDANRG